MCRLFLVYLYRNYNISMSKEDKLYNEIKEYCSLNGIDDVEAFSYKCLLDGFNIVRYGMSPSDNIKKQNNVSNDVKVVKKKRKIIVKND